MTTLSEIEPGNFKATLTWMCGNWRGTFPLIQDGLFLKRYHEAAQREEGFQKRVKERNGERIVQREEDTCRLLDFYIYIYIVFLWLGLRNMEQVACV